MLISQEKYGIFGYDAEAEKTKERKQKGEKKERLLLAAALSFFVMSLCVFFLQAWIGVSERPLLQLQEETVTLKKGELFDAARYVRAAEGRGTLILPGRIDTSQPGRKAAVYRMQYGSREVVRTLLVDVEEK